MVSETGSASLTPQEDEPEPGGPTPCRLLMEPAPRPKAAFLNFFWHRPNEFKCTRLQPRDGPINSNDTGWGGYYHARFQRLERAGVDVLGFVFTGFAAPDLGIDRLPLRSEPHGRSLGEAMWLAKDVGLPVFVYYDLNVRTVFKSGLCKVPPPANQYQCRDANQRPVSHYNLNRRRLFEQLRNDFVRIKDDYILPHLDTYYFLEDEKGERILDEMGLPRPVLAIYIARELLPNQGITKLVEEVTTAYRADGLGQPAFVLDSIFWKEPTKAEVVRRFGTSAVALTSFFPVSAPIADELEIEWMVDWVPQFRRLYREAADEIVSERLNGVQVWPGLGSMFDNTRIERRTFCEPPEHPITPSSKWHLRSSLEWAEMVNAAYDSAYVPRLECPGDDAAPRRSAQPLIINYENEWRESAITDCVEKTRNGQPGYPFLFGCELLNTFEQLDRYP